MAADIWIIGLSMLGAIGAFCSMIWFFVWLDTRDWPDGFPEDDEG